MTVNELLQFLKQNGNQLRQSLMEGNYEPQPVRRVEIPKPDGGRRPLGILIVVDRVIQQAIAQILSPIYEMQFSANSYGFRVGKSAKQAILKCKEYIDAGYTWTIGWPFYPESATQIMGSRLLDSQNTNHPPDNHAAG